MRQGLAAHTSLSAEYIGMGNLSCLHCILKMLLYLVMSQYFFKTQHIKAPFSSLSVSAFLFQKGMFSTGKYNIS